MKVKIDTKEKFRVFTPEEDILTANMTEELMNSMISGIGNSPGNAILNLTHVVTIDDNSAQNIATTQQSFYEANRSMVICNLQPTVENFLDEKELLEVLNVTPTESEAWDIVQMEELERELL